MSPCMPIIKAPCAFTLDGWVCGLLTPVFEGDIWVYGLSWAKEHTACEEHAEAYEASYEANYDVP